MQKILKITADYRETPSGIPDLLSSFENVELKLENMKAGDYFLNNNLLIERKSKEDFVQSLMQNRLFEQCLKLVKNSKHRLFIVEGNPYKTNHEIKPEAIKGALLSISVSWQIPMFFTKNAKDTSKLILLAGNQMLKTEIYVKRKGHKPKREKNLQLFFLQGLPLVGPGLALRLSEHFGNIEKIMKSPEKELQKISGIGKEKAKKIHSFIRENKFL